MDKVKLLTVVVIALLLVNMGVIGFLLAGKNHPNGPVGEGPKKLIIEKLHFDQNQQEQYDHLIHWHRSQINALDMQIQQAKNKLYLQLVNPTVNNEVKDSLIAQINRYQKQIETVHFTHFQDIKRLCKPNQLADYNDLTTELSMLFSKPPRPKHG